jgi:hypothetical protein
MTISINPVDNVLKAYRKHNKPLNSAGHRAEAAGTPTDTVTLSCAADKPEATEKTAYSLLDVLLQSR